MTDGPKIDYDTYVLGNFVRVANRISRGSSALYRRRFGVGVVEWRIMNALAVCAATAAGEICDITGMDKAPISRGVRTLVDRGLVAVNSDPGDQRRQALTLTEAGRDLYREMVPVALERERRFLSALSPEDAKTLRRLLLLLRDHAREMDEPER